MHLFKKPFTLFLSFSVAWSSISFSSFSYADNNPDDAKADQKRFSPAKVKDKTRLGSAIKEAYLRNRNTLRGQSGGRKQKYKLSLDNSQNRTRSKSIRLTNNTNYKWILTGAEDGSQHHVQVEMPRSAETDIYKVAPKALWNKFKGTTVGQTTLQFPPEALAFYMAIGLSTAIQLAVAAEKDPFAMKTFLESLKDPVSYASFYVFMYTNRKVASMIYGLKGMADLQHIMKTHRLTGGAVALTKSGKVAGKGALALAQGMSVPVSYFGMAAGSFASEIFAELVTSPDVQQCATGLIALSQKNTSADERARWREVCHHGFAHFVNEESRSRHMGSILALLSGAAALAVADGAVVKLTKRRLAGNIVKVLGFLIPFGGGAPSVAVKVAGWSERVLHFLLFFGSIELVGTQLEHWYKEKDYRRKINNDFAALVKLRDIGEKSDWIKDPVLDRQTLNLSPKQLEKHRARCANIANRDKDKVSKDLDPADGYDSWLDYDAICNPERGQRSFFSTLKDFSQHNQQWRRALLMIPQAAFASWSDGVSRLAVQVTSARTVYKDFVQRIQKRQQAALPPPIPSDVIAQGGTEEEEDPGLEYDSFRTADQAASELLTANEVMYNSIISNPQANEAPPLSAPKGSSPAPSDGPVSRWPIFDELFAHYATLAENVGKVIEASAQARTKDKLDKNIIKDLSVLQSRFQFANPLMPLPQSLHQDIRNGLLANNDESFDLARDLGLTDSQIDELADKLARAYFLIEGTTMAWALFNDQYVGYYPELKRVSAPVKWESPLGNVEIPFFGNRGFEIIAAIVQDLPENLVTNFVGQSPYAMSLESELLLNPEQEDLFPSKVGRAKVRTLSEYMLISMVCGPPPADPSAPNYAQNSQAIHRPWGKPSTLRPPRIVGDVGFNVCEDIPNTEKLVLGLGMNDNMAKAQFSFNPFSQIWYKGSNSDDTYDGILDIAAQNIAPTILKEGVSNLDYWWFDQVLAPWDYELDRQSESYQMYLRKYLYPAVAGHEATYKFYRPITGFTDVITNIGDYISGRDNNILYWFKHIFKPDEVKVAPADTQIYDPTKGSNRSAFSPTALGSINNEGMILLKSINYVASSLLEKEAQPAARAKGQELTTRFSNILAEIQQMYITGYQTKDIEAKVTKLYQIMEELFTTFHFRYIDFDVEREKQQEKGRAMELYKGLSDASERADKYWQYSMATLPAFAFAVSGEPSLPPPSEGVEKFAPDVAKIMQEAYTSRLKLIEGIPTKLDELPAAEKARFIEHRKILVYSSEQLFVLIDEVNVLGQMGRKLSAMEWIEQNN